MPLDPIWFEKLAAMPELAEQDTLVVDGVEIELPVASSGSFHRLRQWQRRVLSDVMPDSVNADAPERTLFRVLYKWTSGQATDMTIEAALAGEFAPLEEVFRAQLKQKKMTLAFHVLAVKAADKKESEAKGFTDRTLLLLCRRADGSVNLDLMRALIEQFRRSPADLDLAQRTLVNTLVEGWGPELEPTFSPPDEASGPEVPFDPEACALFQEDVRTLIDAKLPPADFFHQLNLLLSLHLGLYQPRLASLLNPQMEYLFADCERPDERNRRDIDSWRAQHETAHPFEGSLVCRAPDPDLRTVTLTTPARESFNRLSRQLATLHFHLLLLVQLRRLGEAWFASQWEQLAAWREDKLDADARLELAARVRGPREFIDHMHTQPEFRRYLDRALTALAVRFIHHQIAEPEQANALEEVRRAPSPLHAMRHLYERYNIQSSKNVSASRAVQQGVKITSGLLSQGQYGLIQGRQRVGPFFEVGAGLLPLLILLSVGSGQEKVPVATFWSRLARYGLSFDLEERGYLLERLRAMGVYERYSDAGEAAYVRNLMTTTKAA